VEEENKPQNWFEKNQKWLILGVSYVLVAVLAVSLTLSIVLLNLKETESTGKLEALEKLLLENFIGDADQKALEDAAADAMVEAIEDPWSFYIPADQYGFYQEQQKNAYVGIGVTISGQSDDRGWKVVEVTAGAGADEAGLWPGDVIVAVDGVRVAGMPLVEVRNLIRGDENTGMDLTYFRDGAEVTVQVIRKQIKQVVAKGQMLPGKVGLVTIENFNANCKNETCTAIRILLDEGAEKLIFDVRNNPGGYVKELVPLLDYLLPAGILFQTEDYSGKKKTETSDASCIQVPMAVLVNGESYSAAEFFAAALSEYEAAVVVGEQTTGKGYFQTVYTLPDGSAVNLSIGKYYTPKGVNLAGVGITPDVVVPVDKDVAAAIVAGTLTPADDPQIQAALEALKDAQ
jgi:carboxyl-terminal processing protease